MNARDSVDVEQEPGTDDRAALIPDATHYFIGYKLNVTGTTEQTHYQLLFFSWLGFFSQVPEFLINVVSVVVAFHGAAVRQVYACLAVVVLVIAANESFVFIDTSSWTDGFFWLTMATVAVFFSANGMYENCLWGFVADFPPLFINAVVIGNNFCGVLISSAAIVSLVVAPNGDVRTAACIYFSFALFTAVLCLASFAVLCRLPYAKYYRTMAREAEAAPEADVDIRAHMRKIAATVQEKWQDMLCVFLTFFVTLALFPAVVGTVNQAGQIPLSEVLFHPVVVFLNFNLAALGGNLIADYTSWRPSSKSLLGFVGLRILFFPLLLFSNFGGDLRRFPALITNDVVFCVLVCLLGLTQGYCSSLSMMFASKGTDNHRSRDCGTLASLFCVLGVCAGANFTFLENLLMLH
ncbi:equilibrative nucleoside transporter [Aphelenchoides avenae]|nr:equilibrative nucleoside transporter [Aphelenchus avenae]